MHVMWRCFAISVFEALLLDRTPPGFIKIPGDHIKLETPVTIPTTEVKQLKPMVLAKTERVGRCRD